MDNRNVQVFIFKNIQSYELIRRLFKSILRRDDGTVGTFDLDLPSSNTTSVKCSLTDGVAIAQWIHLHLPSCLG